MHGLTPCLKSKRTKECSKNIDLGYLGSKNQSTAETSRKTSKTTSFCCYFVHGCLQT